MKRTPIVITATVAGLAGLLSYHTKSAISSTSLGSGTPLGTPSGSGSSTTSTLPGSTTTPSTSTSQPATTTTQPTTTTVPPSTSTTTPAQKSTTTTVPKTTTTTAPTTTTTTTTTVPKTGSGSATGEAVNYSYGVLEVAVTMSGGKITNVTVPQLDDGGNFRSQSIDQQSIPILEQEVLQAQSANIQSVSGASYTSAGFIQSLQNALSKLGY